MANRGRPKKNSEENVEVEIMSENDITVQSEETIESAIGVLSDSLQVDGDVRILSTIIDDVDVEAEELDPATAAEVESALDDSEEVVAEVAPEVVVTDTPYDDSYYQLMYKDQDNYPWTHKPVIVATEEEAQLWCSRGPLDREIRTYVKLTKLTIK